MRRNPTFQRLKAGYLFPEIQKRKTALAARLPSAKILSLGIGNTTEPLLPHITEGLKQAAARLGTLEGYSGYGESQGNQQLRSRIAEVIYGGRISADEVFISDGSKCDIGRLQFLFGAGASFAVQDPSYPVFVDGSVLAAQSGDFDPLSGRFKGVTYLPCVPENNFFPELSSLEPTDVIYVCSPNNPTGAVATHKQLQSLVAAAKRNKSLVVFDGAYSMFVQDATFPKSIYEIDGAKDVCIELGSFSKPAGFTGVRLGWSIVPAALRYDDGTSVRQDWDRLTCTIFNGASNIAQAGGLAALEPAGLREMRQMIAFYLENAALLRAALLKSGVEIYGGDNAPYIWARFPGRTSWESFDALLEHAHIVSTPGSGFGASGEGFLRLSAFGHRADIEEACVRLSKFCSEHL